MQKTINSIKNQTFKNFEVWVIDGQSTVSTQNYLEKLESPFFYLSEKDKGIYDAMNTGVDVVKGEWVYFLGSGDVLHNEHVLETVFSNSIPKEYSLIAGKIKYDGEKSPFIYSKHKKIKNPSWSFSIWLRNNLHHQGTFYKRTLFLQTKYSLEYKVLSDYWFNISLFKNNMKCFLVDLMVATCNSEGVSKTGNWEIYREEVQLKVDQSSILLSPLFYSFVFVKIALRKLNNG